MAFGGAIFAPRSEEAAAGQIEHTGDHARNIIQSRLLNAKLGHRILQPLGVRAVSYTHLDVYKRQPPALLLIILTFDV